MSQKFNYYKVLHFIIEDNIAEAKYLFDRPDEVHKLAGAIAGLNACRNKDPMELIEVYRETRGYLVAMVKEGRSRCDDYWWFRYYQVHVELVCDVISAMADTVLVDGSDSSPLLKGLPTSRGIYKANIIKNNSSKL